MHGDWGTAWGEEAGEAPPPKPKEAAARSGRAAAPCPSATPGLGSKHVRVGQFVLSFGCFLSLFSFLKHPSLARKKVQTADPKSLLLGFVSIQGPLTTQLRRWQLAAGGG